MSAAGAFVFGIPFTGSFLLLLLGLVLFILSVVGLGLMVSAVSKTQQQAILGAFAIGVPAVLLSGFATPVERSEEHTSELQSLMRISYAVFCLKKKKQHLIRHNNV